MRSVILFLQFPSVWFQILDVKLWDAYEELFKIRDEAYWFFRTPIIYICSSNLAPSDFHFSQNWRNRHNSLRFISGNIIFYKEGVAKLVDWYDKFLYRQGVLKEDICIYSDKNREMNASVVCTRKSLNCKMVCRIEHNNVN